MQAVSVDLCNEYEGIKSAFGIFAILAAALFLWLAATQFLGSAELGDESKAAHAYKS